MMPEVAAGTARAWERFFPPDSPKALGFRLKLTAAVHLEVLLYQGDWYPRLVFPRPTVARVQGQRSAAAAEQWCLQELTRVCAELHAAQGDHYPLLSEALT
jgi:hypothetical protein